MKKKKIDDNFWRRPVYKGMTFEKVVYRTGALDMLANPSRVGRFLYYPDGRVVKDA